MGMKKKNAKKIKKNSKLYDGRVAIRNAKRSINLRHPSEIAVIIFWRLSWENETKFYEEIRIDMPKALETKN